MRVFAWLCVGMGIMLAVASFVLTANTPAINPWPSLVMGLCLTTVGIVVLAIRRNLGP